MPLLLPTDDDDDHPNSQQQQPPELTRDDLRPLLDAAREQERAAQQERRRQREQQQQQQQPHQQTAQEAGVAAPASASSSATAAETASSRFAELLSELMGRRSPALLARSLALAQHGTLRDLLLQLPDTYIDPCTVLYVAQHEYAVLAPSSSNGPAPAFIVSDEATTCHLVGLREPITGVVGLAHVDAVQGLTQDLGSMERRVWHEVERAGSQALRQPPTRTLDVYVVGGYAAPGGGDELTAAILDHFAADGDGVAEYRLQVALVSGLNTTMLPHPSSDLATEATAAAAATAGARGAEKNIPAPRCRSLGFCLATGQAFTGKIPRKVKGPMRALRALRLWGWGARNLVEVGYMAAKDGEGNGSVVIPPFHYRGNTQAAALLAVQDDEELVYLTSTSPEVEATGFAHDMRETLTLLVTTRPEEFFGPLVTDPAVAPLERVDLRALVLGHGGGGGGLGGEGREG